MAIGGLIGPVRAYLEGLTSVRLPGGSQGLGAQLAQALGLRPAIATGLATGAITLAVLGYCFADSAFRSSPVHILSGLGVGACAILGWALTGLAYDELATRPTDPISLTYVRPTGDTLEWLQRFTATPWPGFGVATVLGAVLGSLAAAVAMGRFHIVGFSDTGDTVRSLLGATLMGLGGVMAMGCTVGQAITGVSTLAIGSFLTFVAIIFGGISGIRALERWLMSEA